MKYMSIKQIGVMILLAGVFAFGGCGAQMESEQTESVQTESVQTEVAQEGIASNESTQPEALSLHNGDEFIISSQKDEGTITVSQLRSSLRSYDSKTNGELVLKIAGDTKAEELVALVDEKTARSLEGDFVEGYIIKRVDGKCFWLWVYDLPVDYETWIFEMQGYNMKFCSCLSGRITGKELSSDKIQAVLGFQMLGSYTATMDYHLGEDGKIIRSEEFFVFDETDSNYELTVARDLPVLIGGENRVLAPGSKIKITGTDYEDEISFVIPQTGEEGMIPFEWMYGAEVTIAELSEEEYFESLPYIHEVSMEDATDTLLVISMPESEESVTISFEELEQYLQNYENGSQGEPMINISEETGNEAMATILGTDIGNSTRGYGSFYGGYILRKENGRCFWLMNYDVSGTDGNKVFVYEMTGNKMERSQELFYYSRIGECTSSEQIKVNHIFDLLGTYSSDMQYVLNENGRLEPQSTVYEFIHDGVRKTELTLEKDLPVIINGESTMLSTGTVILITGTNNAGELYYQILATGEVGTIQYEESQEGFGGVFIDGLHETEYFGDYLPYAG